MRYRVIVVRIFIVTVGERTNESGGCVRFVASDWSIRVKRDVSHENERYQCFVINELVLEMNFCEEFENFF